MRARKKCDIPVRNYKVLEDYFVTVKNREEKIDSGEKNRNRSVRLPPMYVYIHTSPFRTIISRFPKDTNQKEGEGTKWYYQLMTGRITERPMYTSPHRKGARKEKEELVNDEDEGCRKRQDAITLAVAELYCYHQHYVRDVELRVGMMRVKSLKR